VICIKGISLDSTRGATIAYKPELDGLRALAVTAVVAFHLGRLDAGFLGVDIFFVLSGYLITKVLLAKNGDQSVFKDFYQRRFFACSRYC
jgi:peptidoglycan/LPS O-acetylase OafA/YrhL